MRISTPQIYQQGLQSLHDRQEQLSRLQRQLASGDKLLDPSDDPTASAWLARTREQVTATEQYQRNIGLGRSRLSVGDTALGNVGDILQRAREITVQANNAPLNDTDRRSLAIEARELNEELIIIANTRDGAGDFVFAGYQTNTTPFVRSGSQVNYQGDQGYRQLEVGPQRLVTVDTSGTEVFQNVRKGNGTFQVNSNAANTGTGEIHSGTLIDPSAWNNHDYTITFSAPDRFDVTNITTGATVLANQSYTNDSSAIVFDGIQTAIDGDPATGDSFTVQASKRQDLFATLDTLANALESGTSNPAESAQLHQTLANSLSDLDQGIAHISETRGKVGARLRALDDHFNANEDLTLRLKELEADLNSLDYAGAAMRLNSEVFALEAAQQSFVKIQNLSLFNLLR